MPVADFTDKSKVFLFIALLLSSRGCSPRYRDARLFCPQHFPKSANVTHLPLTAGECSERMSFWIGKIFSTRLGSNERDGAYHF
jgi:hypothetical protein